MFSDKGMCSANHRIARGSQNIGKTLLRNENGVTCLLRQQREGCDVTDIDQSTPEDKSLKSPGAIQSS